MTAVVAERVCVPAFNSLLQLQDAEWRAVFQEIGVESYSRSVVSIKGRDSVIPHEVYHLVEAIAQTWNVQPIRFPKMPKVTQDEIKHAGAVFSCLLNLVIGVHGRNHCGYTHAGQWFRDIYLEAEVTAPFLVCDKSANSVEETTLSKDRIIKQIRRQDRMLWARTPDELTGKIVNPFAGYATRQLFDLAMAYSIQYTRSESNTFHHGIYAPFLKTRAKAVKWWEQNGMLCIHDQKKAYVSVKSHGFRPYTPGKPMKEILG